MVTPMMWVSQERACPVSGAQVRQAFVRKVLGIVLVQLLVTVGASVSGQPPPNTPLDIL